MIFSNPVLLLLLLTAIGLASAKDLPTRDVLNLPRGTRLDDIVVRPNGDLLVVQHSPKTAHPSSDVVSIPDVDHILGITELPHESASNKEMYAVVASKEYYRSESGVGAYKFSVWTVTITPSRSKRKPRVKVAKVSDMAPDSYGPSAITSIPGVSDAVLIADGFLGSVGRLDLTTGVPDPRSFVALEMMPDPGKVGVNYIRIHGGYLYFTAKERRGLYRIRASPEGTPVRGHHQTARLDNSDIRGPGPRGFAFDANGHVYFAAEKAVGFVYVDKKKGVIVVDSSKRRSLAGATALAFGRGKNDNETLYVTTLHGKVVAVDTSSQHVQTRTGPRNRT
ncbi:hypothetical protein FZEAL_5689 [Fusarium zealandicum]|uniref:SMP-30/Gluconolactonase/LRE-like region domain-containing protein n=1 Tax=Fusarium zealandicum TaxID=1053134 RepID=A0A8H4UJQ4_9HYPO|nr:hypothetical protein FZEAL_5689 [Fusarium zealandicum]